MTEPISSTPASGGVVPGRKAGNLLGLRDVSAPGRSGGCGCGGRGHGSNGGGGCGCGGHGHPAPPQTGAVPDHTA